MEFSSQEKNKRCEDFWRREHAKNNFKKSEKKFEELWKQSGPEDYDNFMDHYLIDLYNRKDILSKKEFIEKVLEFHLVHTSAVDYECELEEPLKENQYRKYINNIFRYHS